MYYSKRREAIMFGLLHEWMKEKCPTYTGLFDNNEELILKLQKLEKINKESDAQASSVSKILRTIDEQYAALVQQSQSELDVLQVHKLLPKNATSFTRNTFSEQTCSIVDRKKAILETVDRKIEQSQMMQKKLCLERQCRFLEEDIGNYKKKITVIERELELSRKEIEDLKNQMKHPELKENIVISENTLKECQDKLVALGLNEAVHPESLIKKVKELEALRSEIDRLNADMSIYNNIPPDISQAKQELKKIMLKDAQMEEEIKKKSLGISY